MKALSIFFSAVIIALFLLTEVTYAQSTIVTLPTADNTSSFNVTKSDNTNMLRIFGDGGFYLGGTYGIGSIPITGAGTRMMWYPAKAAFRVGDVTGSNWDADNVGVYSFASGIDSKAKGSFSVAMGAGTVASEISCIALGDQATASGIISRAMGWLAAASGDISTAMGSHSTASGGISTAMGSYTTASGGYSTAMGYYTTASGDASTAMGQYSKAIGGISIAMGDSTIASGYASLAIGFRSTASGNHSTAMGNFVSTGNREGAFIIGDNSTLETASSAANNLMTMRFAGGYRLFTNSEATVGVSLAAGGSSWSVISDSTKKENFIIANGEYFLNSLSQLRLGSWNYKRQEPAQYRHYGPMAQEIFYYFGNDGIGTIGNSTSLASADMDGIMMVCLQALEKRTADLQIATARITDLEKKLSEQQSELSSRNEAVDELKNEFFQLKKEIAAVLELKKSPTDASLTSTTSNK
jgi:hypothetical protein